MGCASSKHSSALDKKLKGTVLVAFRYKGGIVVGVESRGSTEDKPNYPLAIRDNINKMVDVSDKLIYVYSGSHADCLEMNKHIRKKLPNTNGYGGNAPTVSSVVETMYEYLSSLHDKEIACGAIIAGLDASGPQIHCVFSKDGKVVKEEPLTKIAALGSGQVYARMVIQEGLKHIRSTAGAIDLAWKALYCATYHDKHCGGELRVFTITEEDGWVERPRMDAMDAYLKYYEFNKDEQETLLLVVDAKMEPISANDLVQHFCNDDRSRPTLLASHRAALCAIGDDHFYFHRLVFESKRKAERAYEKTSPHGRTSPQYLEWFPNQAVLDNKPSVTVYVNWSSKDLLKLIHDQCQVVYKKPRSSY